MIKNIFFFSFLLMLQLTTAAQDSSRLRISLLTCSPGDELYSVFGHSAMRVIDSNSVTDHVYNYGTFDFSDKDFYVKFARGKLPYYLSVDQFSNFKEQYIYENRKMYEQVLTVPGADKRAFYEFLLWNAQPANREYRYDFFLDNCTTRLRDLMLKHAGKQTELPAVMPADFTFRDAIHQYLDSGKKYWSKLGIDILLGRPTDAVMTPEQQQFLPDNLMMAADRASSPIVMPAASQYITIEKREERVIHPALVFSIVLLFYIALMFAKGERGKRIRATFDAFLFFSAGLLGILLVLMWVATDHSMTKDNYNLLWAWPFHVIPAISLFWSGPKTRFYFRVYALFMLLFLACWAFLPQNMNEALLPLIILLFFRAAARSLR